MQKTLEVECLKAHTYAQRHRKKGDKFRIEAQDAHVLAVTGMVKVLGEPVTAEGSPETVRYKRRDLRAKD